MHKRKLSPNQATLSGATLEDEKKATEMLASLIKVFTNPIIGHAGWADTITAEQKERIRIERLAQIMKAKGQPITEATDYEAMIYVMTASLANPLNRDWFNIYAYLFRKFYPEQAKTIFSEHEGIELAKYTEARELQRLKQWLWKTQNKK